MYVQYIEVIAKKKRIKKLALIEIVLLLSLRFLYGTSDTSKVYSRAQDCVCLLRHFWSCVVHY